MNLGLLNLPRAVKDKGKRHALFDQSGTLLPIMVSEAPRPSLAAVARISPVQEARGSAGRSGAKVALYSGKVIETINIEGE